MKKQLRICEKCNAEIEPNQNFCPVCGAKVEPKKHSKKTKVTVAGAAVLVAVASITAALVLVPAIKKQNAYKEAVSCYTNGQYEQAQEQFESLGDYKDCKQKAIDACIGRAEQFLNEQDFDNAREILKTVEKSDTVKNMENQCDYKEAEMLVKKEEYEGAYKIFEKLVEKQYKDSDVLAKETLPKAAKATYEEIIETYKNTEAYRESGSYTYFDLQKDGLDELFISSGYGDLKVYSYQKGKINTLLDAKVGYYVFFVNYDFKSKILQVSTSGDDPIHDWYYKLTDKLEYIGTMSWDGSSRYVYEAKGKKRKYKTYEDVYNAIGFSGNAENIEVGIPECQN